MSKNHSSNGSKRISVIGVSGSGKSTFAREIAKALGAKCIELDSLHWEANWTEAELSVFRERAEAAMDCDGWVCDGNYNKVRDLVWSRADTVVWLDYSFLLIMYRLFIRTIKRVFTGEKLWADNQESLSTHLFTNDSIFLWAFKTYFRHKAEFPKYLQEPEYAHLNLVRLKTPAEAQAYIKRKGEP